MHMYETKSVVVTVILTVVILSIALLGSTHAKSTALILGQNGSTDYQIVLPEVTPNKGLDEDLAQKARLMQAAFKANGIDIAVVREQNTTAGRPRIYLGNTQRAKSSGIDVQKLSGWSYVLKVIGRDVCVVEVILNVMAQDISVSVNF